MHNLRRREKIIRNSYSNDRMLLQLIELMCYFSTNIVKHNHTNT